MNDDVEGLYTNPIPNSCWLSGLKREVFGGAFRYRIGIGFVSVGVQNLIVYRMDPIPILYQNALLKVVLLEENRAPARSVLTILKKIAFPCGAS